MASCVDRTIQDLFSNDLSDSEVKKSKFKAEVVNSCYKDSSSFVKVSDGDTTITVTFAPDANKNYRKMAVLGARFTFFRLEKQGHQNLIFSKTSGMFAEKGLAKTIVKEEKLCLADLVGRRKDESIQETKFWNTPELVEILLSFLDAKSAANLAEVHCISLAILQCPRAWNNFIRRSCPQLEEGEDVKVKSESEKWWTERETREKCLRKNDDKVVALSHILDLSKAPHKLEMQMDLLHLLCKRFPGSEEFVHCNQVGVVVKSTCSHYDHHVTELGFMLLYRCNVGELQIESAYTTQLREPRAEWNGREYVELDDFEPDFLAEPKASGLHKGLRDIAWRHPIYTQEHLLQCRYRSR